MLEEKAVDPWRRAVVARLKLREMGPMVLSVSTFNLFMLSNVLT